MTKCSEESLTLLAMYCAICRNLWNFLQAPSENRDFGPPPPLDFGTIAYWSRGFWYNRLRLLIGRELALDLGLLLEDCLKCFNCLHETGDCTLLTCCVRTKFGHKREKTKVAQNCLKCQQMEKTSWG